MRVLQNIIIRYQRKSWPPRHRIEALLKLPGVVRAERTVTVYVDVQVEQDRVPEFLEALSNNREWRLYQSPACQEPQTAV